MSSGAGCVFQLSFRGTHALVDSGIKVHWTRNAVQAMARGLLCEKAGADGLPAGWEERWSTTRNRPYYFESSSGCTTWIRPTTSSAAAHRENFCGGNKNDVVASIDFEAVPDAVLEQLSACKFPALLKANTRAGSIVGVKVPVGFTGQGKRVNVMVPANAPLDECFWIVAPLPAHFAGPACEDKSSSWVSSKSSVSSSEGSAATTALHDSGSRLDSGSIGDGRDVEFEQDDRQDGVWEFEKHEQQVRELAQAARAARAASPDYASLAPGHAAAPAVLISRTPSPQALCSASQASQPQQDAGNPFTRQLNLLRKTESHNATLIDVASLPVGWEKRISSSKGKSYYYNRTTGVTTWVRPTEGDGKESQ